MGPGRTEKVWLPYGLTKCSDAARPVAYTTTAGYIVICPRTLPPFWPATVGDRNADYYEKGPQRTLDDMGFTISVSIFHELLHEFFTPPSKSRILEFLFPILNLQVGLISGTRIVVNGN